MSWLLDPLAQYGFMRTGLAAALLVGVTSALLSCLLVVRHQALLGDAISHTVLLGVVVGYLVGGTTGILGGALLVAVVAGLVITYVERRTTVQRDAVMGIVFTAAFAGGLAILSAAQPRGIDLLHILFGNVLGVGADDLLLTAVSAAIVLVSLALLRRPLALWSFDPELARTLGVRTALLDYAFTALLGVTVVTALQAVGLVLVVAMLVTPGATGVLLGTRLRTVAAVAVGVGVIAAVAGLYSSFYVDVASGPAIVLVASACFAVAFAITRVRARRAVS